MAKQKEVFGILAKLENAKEVDRFCREILTPKEIEDLSLRWQLLKELHQGEPQRAIAARHGISLCKITRGSKILKTKGSFIHKILNRLQAKRKEHE